MPEVGLDSLYYIISHPILGWIFLDEGRVAFKCYVISLYCFSDKFELINLTAT